MESWVPLFNIFMNSPTPETEASLWLQRSFNASSSVTATTTITPTSFISLLAKPYDAIVADPSSSPAPTKRVMFLQTLPNMVQSRILSFLALEHDRFSNRDLSRLARDVLGGNGDVDFWVRKAARNLLDVLSKPSYEWISCLSLDSGGDSVQDEFASVPGWLSDAVAVGMDDLFVPWLPISPQELDSRNVLGAWEEDLDLDLALSSQARVDDDDDEEEEEEEEFIDAVVEGIEIGVPLGSVVREMADSLRARIMHFESGSRTVTLADEIRELCLGKGVDSFAVLGLLETWKVDDETASVLISHLSSGSEDELAWPSQVLCATVLPKLLALQEPASRVLVTSTIEYCKLHQRATVYALLFPLILHKEGINNPICDVITRIIKECLHPAHVSAFCQKLLCGGEDERRFICLPCHRYMICNELVWTESLFNLFQNILNCNVHLTHDSVDVLVHQVRQLTARFSKSLKFGNFLLCFVTKCFPSLKAHKLLLIEATEDTKTVVTKSVLSKLATF